jgi:hypothetical protein
LDREVDKLSEEHRKFLREMLERNVLWWKNRAEWDLMLQYEILDRKLVTKDSNEHKALLELLEEARNG